MSLEWHGKRVLKKIEEAQKAGINKIMSEAVIHAKQNHDWRNRTGTLEGSIKIAQFAKRQGSGFAGVWGSADVVYALIHELGGKIVPVNAPKLVFEIEGQTIVTDEVNIPASPYLRPAANATYPRLAEEIRKALLNG